MTQDTKPHIITVTIGKKEDNIHKHYLSCSFFVHNGEVIIQPITNCEQDITDLNAMLENKNLVVWIGNNFANTKTNYANFKMVEHRFTQPKPLEIAVKAKEKYTADCSTSLKDW